jgi:phosphohistidine phosphatase
MRHASAADVAPSDAERPLTPAGRDEASVTGRALLKLGANPTTILSSPLLRARETATIVARELGLPSEIIPCDLLANSHTTTDLLRALQRPQPPREALLVGHMPGVADDLAVILGTESASGLSFGRATIACVELARPLAGHGELVWFLHQKQQRLLL